MNNTVSIIITSKNNLDNLIRLYNSIINQSYKNYEILIIDNFSEDETKNYFKNKNVKFYSHGPERSSQRNYGIKKAKNELILILDSDMILNKNLIHDCIALIKKGYEAIYIQETILSNSQMQKIIRNHERLYYSGSFNDCPRFLKKELVHRIGFFDENLTGPEDWDFNNRFFLFKVKTYNFNKKNLLFHDERNLTFFDTAFKKKRYLKDFKKYKKKWSSHKVIIFYQLNPFYRFFFIYFFPTKNLVLSLKNPFKTLVLFFYKVFSIVFTLTSSLIK